MKNLSCVLILSGLLIITQNSQAQLTVDNTTWSPAQLVQNVLAGTGVTISNVTLNGVAAGTPAESVGYFSAFGTTLPIQEGVLLGTGDVQVANGPNSMGSATQGGTGAMGGDPDLNAISSVTIYDQAILEFDFIPVGDTVRFNYSFASEEYNEFVCSGFNDVFGFFISGPGFAGPFSNGGVNIALIPGTTTPVAINTVNPGVAGSSGTAANCSAIDPNWASYNIYYNTNTANWTEYDGYTVSLEAMAIVQCGQTYHIKLAIADGGDGSYDSGVFLQAGSFSSSAVEVNVTTVSGMDVIYEGCSPAQFTFIRPDTTGDLTVFFDILGNAVNGTDYNQIADSIFFQSGIDSINLFIGAIQDFATEGVDTVSLVVYTINPCGDTLISIGTIYIWDSPDIVIDVPDTTLQCPVSNLIITATATGGEPPYTFYWDDGTFGPTISIPNPSVDDTLIVFAEDACSGLVFQDTVIIDIQFVPLNLTAFGDTTLLCPGDPAMVYALVTGGYTPYTYSWNTGSSNDSIYVNPNFTTEYYITISDSCGQINLTDTVIVTVPQSTMVVTIPEDSVYCPGDDLVLLVNVNGGTGPYTYNWSNGSNADTTLVNPMATSNYSVSVTDVCGRIDNDIVTVSVPLYGPIELDTLPTTVVCVGDPVYYTATATGGEGTFGYNWYYGTTDLAQGNPVSFIPPITGIYTVYATDFCGNTGFQDFYIISEVCAIFIPNIVTANGDFANETWVIENIDKFDHLVQIYNRWGKLIFESDNYQNNWNGDGYSDGTYFYIVTLFKNDGTEENHKGHLTLMKD